MTIRKILVLSVMLLSGIAAFFAFDQTTKGIQPFILADRNTGDFSQNVKVVRDKLENAGFEILGSYMPYDNAEVVVFTNEELKKRSTQTRRGGYGAVMRASVTRVENEIEIAYTNPVYWSNAYRLSNNNKDILDQLKHTLGFQQEFGAGDKILSEQDMRQYHYTMLMEYFDDPSKLNEFENYEQAVKTIENNLAAKIAGVSKIFQLNLGKDPSGTQMTLFGVALSGMNAEDCSSDEYIMSRIDKSSPRHTAHLPYEILVYGDKAEALYARFRIAISWPYLPMIRSKTGATFLSIMCAPRAIENVLEKVAGKH